MSTNRGSIRLAHGAHPGDIRDAIAMISPPTDDLWTWYEPRPGWRLDDRGRPPPHTRASSLHPILRPGPILAPRDMPLDEARLFWPFGSLYLVASDAGSQVSTRWALWLVGDGEPALRLARDLGAGPDETASARDGDRVLLQQRIAARFGLEQAALAQQGLRLRLATRDGAVIGWTLYRNGDSGHA